MGPTVTASGLSPGQDSSQEFLTLSWSQPCLLPCLRPCLCHQYVCQVNRPMCFRDARLTCHCGGLGWQMFLCLGSCMLWTHDLAHELLDHFPHHNFQFLKKSIPKSNAELIWCISAVGINPCFCQPKGQFLNFLIKYTFYVFCGVLYVFWSLVPCCMCSCPRFSSIL